MDVENRTLMDILDELDDFNSYGLVYINLLADNGYFTFNLLNELQAPHEIINSLSEYALLKLKVEEVKKSLEQHKPLVTGYDITIRV